MALGSSLGQALGKTLMCSFENKCLKIALMVWTQSSVDGMLMMFILFSSLDHTEKFKEYLYSKLPNINFLLENENDGGLSFLGINIYCEKGKFLTNVYCKKTFSGDFTNFSSFIPETYKTDLVKSLLFRCFSLCSDFVKFHNEINILKGILCKYRYPRDFVDKCIKNFWTVLSPKIIISTVYKKDFMIILPYSVLTFASKSH